MAQRPTVFISYSQHDAAFKDQLLVHLKGLKSQATLWHDRDILTGEEWDRVIKTQLAQCHIAILLLTANFLATDYITDVELPALEKRYNAKSVIIIPVLVSSCYWEGNAFIKSLSLYPDKAKPIIKQAGDVPDAAILTQLVKRVGERLNGLAALPTTPEPQTPPPTAPNPTPRTTPTIVNTRHLPEPGPHFLGRDDELQWLRTQWENSQTSIAELVADGGTGKTTLVAHWLEQLAARGYPGMAHVFAWSFYSQGSSEKRQLSADEFFTEAFAAFQVPELPPSAAPYEKGRALANALMAQPTLLVLDGLEPLQYGPGDKAGMAGELKDDGLKELLKTLALTPHSGLLVITTRVGLKTLEGRSRATRKDLTQLSEAAGTALLRRLGVKADTPEAELRKAVKWCTGHALTLTLLGHYVAQRFMGDLRQADLITQLAHPGVAQGEHARHVMERYAEWFTGRDELAILYLVSLFDRPATLAELKAAMDQEGDHPDPSRALSARADLAGELHTPSTTPTAPAVNSQAWNAAVSQLQQYRLLLDDRTDELDAHPLVREYFAGHYRQQQPEAYQAAHGRLFAYFQQLPDDQRPSTKEDLAPLYRAIYHGCQAGEYLAAFDKVYWERIRRGKEAFSTKQLGLFGQDLGAIAHFFDQPWQQPHTGFSAHDQAVLLNWAGFFLRGLGRLQEALEPMEVGGKRQAEMEDWKNAAIAANNLSELRLVLGQVAGAVQAARQAVDYADRSGDLFWRMGSRAALAEALQQQDEAEEALTLFQEAEDLQEEDQPEYPRLYSLQGYQYCALLLDMGQWEEVRERGGENVGLHGNLGLLSLGLDQLSLARSYLLESVGELRGGFIMAPAQHNDREALQAKARQHLTEAERLLRLGGQQAYIALALLAWAEYGLAFCEHETAKRYLAEVQALSERSGMPLYLADYHLLSAACAQRFGQGTAVAKDHLQHAKTLIDKTGYQRRQEAYAFINNCVTA